MENNNKKYDAAVVGAGPAGMMAAIAAAEAGAKTVLVERNKTAGKKLLLTGGGRCNIANAEFDLRKLISNYGKNGPFLFHPFSKFGPKETVKFFSDLGIKTVIENKQRLFPKSGRAQEVLDVLTRTLEESGVEVVLGEKVANIKKDDGAIEKLFLAGREIVAKNYILATGGKSYPQTGSTGDGYGWAHRLGHRIEKLSPALVPITIKETWPKKLAGTGFPDVKIKIAQSGKKIAAARGEILFAHFGLTGPAILNMSGLAARFLKSGPADIFIDILPDKNVEVLEHEIMKDFSQNPNRAAKHCLARYASLNFVQALLEQTGIDGEKACNNINKKERRLIAGALKSVGLSAVGTLGLEAGMVTAGGVDVSQIDDKTMRSKIIANLYFAGEIINVHGSTGGFNLLQSWSTGHLAGTSASAFCGWAGG